MTEPAPAPHISELPIAIVDTNIFGNLLDKKTVGDTHKILDELSSSYRLAISYITVQEIIAVGSKEVAEILDLFDASFAQFDINQSVIVFAGYMTCVGVHSGCDSIVASTAFLNKAFVLTANQKDFPEPLFNERQFWHINSLDDRKRTKTENIYLLEPDYKQIEEKISNIEYVKQPTKNRG
jgi:predicted nucleic acid-binding protein